MTTPCACQPCDWRFGVRILHDPTAGDKLNSLIEIGIALVKKSNNERLALIS